MRPISLLSDAALPMMLLVLGMQLERATLPPRPKVVFVAVGLSLIVAPLLALGLAWALGLTGTARQAGVVLASMPVAVVTTILALEFDASPAFVTSAVFLSTLLEPVHVDAVDCLLTLKQAKRQKVRRQKASSEGLLHFAFCLCLLPSYFLSSA